MPNWSSGRQARQELRLGESMKNVKSEKKCGPGAVKAESVYNIANQSIIEHQCVME